MSKLFVVPTPIGNLEDITLRAIRILKVDLILAEDTRNSAKLLKHYEIDTPMQSHHMHNEHKTVKKWADKIITGQTLALVTDAGTPAISDPGFLLIRECAKNNIEIDCLPGLLPLFRHLSTQLYPVRSLFLKGLPQKKGRQTRLKILAEEKRTMVFYESPYRIVKTLQQFAEFIGEERPLAVSREISKKFEETKRGTVIEVLEYFKNKDPKGEFVIILEGKK